MALYLIDRTRPESIFNIRILYWVILFLTPVISQAQKDKNIIESFEVYTEAPRETAYVHLNKSTYVRGEMLGFTAYIIDKYSKLPADKTTNLYCTILNEQGEVVKKKLILVENGSASNIFNIDDSLSTGTYTFKVYTNWMKNFDENNHYQQSFKIIDSEDNQLIEPIKFSELEVDLQVLGEGGHMLYDVPNTVGVIARNSLGKAIANADGQIIDNSNQLISEFQLNESGIAKTLFIPEKGKSYTASIFLDDKTISTSITDIKSVGLALTLKKIREDIVVELLTNQNSFALLKGKKLKVALHNGGDLRLTEFILKEQRAVLKFPKNEWFTGVNIITIFDEKNRPILERLFFNKNGIKEFSSILKSKRNTNDSLQITLKPYGIDASQIQNMSISVLPGNTKSYNHHHNIVSQTYLRPYVQGSIENAKVYFQNNNIETDYNLDLVMLTQGWSSYDWNKIFNYNKVAIYPFERGIDVVANLNSKQEGTYITYPLQRLPTQMFDVAAKESQFTIKGITPTQEDLLRVGFINKNTTDFIEKPALYLQFYPNEFASFNNNYENLVESFTVDDTQLSLPKLEESWNVNKVEVLDEVVINALKEKTRAESLQTTIMSKVKIVTDREKLSSQRLDLYLQRLGWQTRFDYFTGQLTITNPRGGTPLVYLDDTILNPAAMQNFNILTFITMEYVDYIESDKTGLNGGLRGAGGFIKIYSDPNNKFKKKIDKTVTYDIPLRFDDNKKFYIPKYQYYNSRFFNEYGTIAWIPNAIPNDKGEFELNIFNTNSDTINLYIEGFSSEGDFISEVKTINPNN